MRGYDEVFKSIRVPQNHHSKDYNIDLLSFFLNASLSDSDTQTEKQRDKLVGSPSEGTSSAQIRSASWHSHGHTGHSAPGQCARARKRAVGARAVSQSRLQKPGKRGAPSGANKDAQPWRAVEICQEKSREKKACEKDLDIGIWNCLNGSFRQTHSKRLRCAQSHPSAGFQRRTGARRTAKQSEGEGAEWGMIQRSLAGRPAGLRAKRGGRGIKGGVEARGGR